MFLEGQGVPTSLRHCVITSAGASPTKPNFGSALKTGLNASNGIGYWWWVMWDGEKNKKSFGRWPGGLGV